MAARFDAQRALELGQGAGDSTPIMATIPTDDPWVPVRILGLGLEDGREVEADVFLLTDREPELLAGGPGITLERSEAASGALLADLRSDAGMEWLPASMWLSYLQVDADAGDLDYDLAVSQDPATSRRSPTPASGRHRSCRSGRRSRHARGGRRCWAGSPVSPPWSWRGGVWRWRREVPPRRARQPRRGRGDDRRRLRARRRRCSAGRCPRSRPGHRARRRRAQPVRTVVRPGRRRHRGALRRQQQRPDQPRADRRLGRRPRPSRARHRAVPRAASPARSPWARTARR